MADTAQRNVVRNQPLLPRATTAWYLLMLLSAAAIGVGVYSYAQQLLHGDIVTGLRNPGNGGAAWGFYIVFYVYFVGVSFAGIMVASMARLFHIDTLKPITRLAELLTIVALIVGAMMVLADLGRPLAGLINLPDLARPSSPFYGTFTLVVSGYLFSSLVYFILAGRCDAAMMARSGPSPLRWLYRLWGWGYRGRPVEHARHWRASFWLALTILPLLIIAHSTLGFIFGIQSGRPGWFSALQAPGFVVMAGVSGTGALILFALLARRLFGLRERITDASVRWLGNFLWVLCGVYLYFMVVEELTATYAAPRADRELAHEIVSGRFALSFWVTVLCLFVAFLFPFLMYVTRRHSMVALGIAAALANVAAVIKRMLIVVPSQTDGSLLQLQPGFYTPTWVEFGVVLGGTGLLTFTMLGFGRWFPLVPTPVSHEARESPVPRDRLRALVTFTWAMGSLALIVIGLMDSFRLWSGDELDPTLRFSPAIFATGVILLFSSAIVYEVWPERKHVRRARAALEIPPERKPPPRVHTVRRSPPAPRVAPRVALRAAIKLRRVRASSHLISSSDRKSRRTP